MFSANEGDAEYRFDDWGPGYLARGPRTDFGLCVLRPGDAFPNHFHRNIEEGFYVLEGEATLWHDCKERFVLTPGDYHRCDPGEMHYFVNESDANFKMAFIKAPWDPDDVVVVEWTPGEPVPDIER